MINPPTHVQGHVQGDALASEKSKDVVQVSVMLHPFTYKEESVCQTDIFIYLKLHYGEVEKWDQK